jgi:hypothetical protein
VRILLHQAELLLPVLACKQFLRLIGPIHAFSGETLAASSTWTCCVHRLPCLLMSVVWHSNGFWQLMAVTRRPCRADHVINQKEEDIVQRVMEITGGEGAYAALDPVAGDFTSTVSYKSAIPQAVVWSACRPGGCARLGTGVHRVCEG